MTPPRTNKHFTLETNPLERDDLNEIEDLEAALEQIRLIEADLQTSGEGPCSEARNDSSTKASIEDRWPRWRTPSNSPSRSRPKSPGIVPNRRSDFWDSAELVEPVRKQAVSLRIDEDVLDWFRQSGPRYQSRMNAVSRSQSCASAVQAVCAIAGSDGSVPRANCRRAAAAAGARDLVWAWPRVAGRDAFGLRERAGHGSPVSVPGGDAGRARANGWIALGSPHHRPRFASASRAGRRRLWRGSQACDPRQHHVAHRAAYRHGSSPQ